MSQIEKLARVYERHVGVAWQRTMAGAQRVMLAVYPKEKERLLRARLSEFDEATRRTGHEWTLIDATPWFAEWMGADEYRDSYFQAPELLGMNLEGGFRESAEDRLRRALEAADDETVVALLGIASLYGFLRVSELIRAVEPSVRGRLLVFFPGTKNENNYRLLDARDGWNYLAQPITLHEAWVP
ncbi:BREX protein BrxB domain-containing protein [Candidatus Palauibacter sp.]|uniref:BREX protein BrxB domain-containing protein n=1 Tax=Candidatus Palauibacter sp. TaxID=3101350 RepID=UPI003C6EEEA8